jgi:hypothetical protein
LWRRRVRCASNARPVADLGIEWFVSGFDVCETRKAQLALRLW